MFTEGEIIINLLLANKLYSWVYLYPVKVFIKGNCCFPAYFKNVVKNKK